MDEQSTRGAIFWGQKLRFQKDDAEEVVFCPAESLIISLTSDI
jgi:hypothetical protein